jgi:hypothetical protein
MLFSSFTFILTTKTAEDGHMTNYKARVLVEGDPQTNYIIALEKETSSLKWMQKVQFNDREDSEYQDITLMKRSPSQKKSSRSSDSWFPPARYR